MGVAADHAQTIASEYAAALIMEDATAGQVRTPCAHSSTLC